jgi:hypothetical protein
METVFNPNQNLNFKRFLLAKLNLIAHINTKILCNDMNATNIDIYLNIFLSFYFSRKNMVLQLPLHESRFLSHKIRTHCQYHGTRVSQIPSQDSRQRPGQSSGVSSRPGWVRRTRSGALFKHGSTKYNPPLEPTTFLQRPQVRHPRVLRFDLATWLAPHFD